MAYAEMVHILQLSVKDLMNYYALLEQSQTTIGEKNGAFAPKLNDQSFLDHLLQSAD